MAQAPTSPPAPPPASTPLLQGFFRLTNVQKVVVLVGVAAAVAITVAFVSLARTPDYKVLFSNVTDRDGGAIISALQQINVPYRMSEGGGAILVPSDRVYESRLRLAQQGLPRGGSIGFELLENQRIGTSQFVEQVNFQRALEGELARTVQALGSVQAARVHLAIPRPSVFVRDQQKPSASVLVSLFPGRALDPAQLAGITHLVASSVPELAPSAVTIVDQAGNLLTQNPSAREGNAGLDAGQLKYVQAVEQNFVRRIEAILTPIVGPGNVRAQVTAELDFSTVEQTAETYKPNPSPEQAIRSQQTVETVGDNPRDASGVPGALSNQPPGTATAPLNAPGKGAAKGGAAEPASPGNTHREATTNYELDKTITHTRAEVGAVRRLSAAVVVNHRRELKEGKAEATPLPEAEIAQLNNLVRQAIGFNEKRGDTVNLVNAAFNEVERVEVEGPTLVTEVTRRLLGNMNTVLWTLAAIVAALFVYLMVLRPVLRDLARAGERDLAAREAYAQAMAAAASAAEAAPAGEGDTGTAPPIRTGGRGFEADLQAVKDLAKQEPQIVANVVKDWVGRE
ncbi:MAG: flagellar M-ring protein FliF [Rhodocyclaceae bacterium]|jgi:flagellar M-ring protein FliF|nr:flagellar M-ring protein FliF [Rhodocyclaceae bacterium]MCE2981745.1 flagellar M-ring protein FliF [Betaproteobacteria bacterium]MCA3072987.1 flagellar M-ring protein FliF [Rhodocyclaceae bacterium]MCA3088737.1 flagellar M-ring protein FliF [Rhodocyclaceae bacterium]MCA3092479.1 flagellar M-ring protein FliF [Rhodocyclaceae bacterium]